MSIQLVLKSMYIYHQHLPIIQPITTRNMAPLTSSHIMALHGVDYTTILTMIDRASKRLLHRTLEMASKVGTCYKPRGWPSRPYPKHYQRIIVEKGPGPVKESLRIVAYGKILSGWASVTTQTTRRNPRTYSKWANLVTPELARLMQEDPYIGTYAGSMNS
jgi:hypothetical protein